MKTTIDGNLLRRAIRSAWKFTGAHQGHSNMLAPFLANGNLFATDGGSLIRWKLPELEPIGVLQLWYSMQPHRLEFGKKEGPVTVEVDDKGDGALIVDGKRYLTNGTDCPYAASCIRLFERAERPGVVVDEKKALRVIKTLVAGQTPKNRRDKVESFGIELAVLPEGPATLSGEWKSGDILGARVSVPVISRDRGATAWTDRYDSDRLSNAFTEAGGTLSLGEPDHAIPNGSKALRFRGKNPLVEVLLMPLKED